MPLHPPPASGSSSSLAKEHVAKEHVCGGVAERSSAACAGARPASGSVVGPLGPARRRVTQVRISSSERLLHLRSGARRDARALAPDQSTRMVYNTTKLCPRSDRNWPLAPRGLCDLFDRDSLCGSLLELDPARAHACPHMQPAPPRAAASCSSSCRRHRLAAQRARARSHAPRATRCAPILCRAARCRPPPPHRAHPCASRLHHGHRAARHSRGAGRGACGRLAASSTKQGQTGSAAAAGDSDRTRPPEPPRPRCARCGARRPRPPLPPHPRACCGRRPDLSAAGRGAACGTMRLSRAGGACPTRSATRGTGSVGLRAIRVPTGASAAGAQSAQGGRARPRAVLGAALAPPPQPAGTRRARRGQGEPRLHRRLAHHHRPQLHRRGQRGDGGGSIVRGRTWLVTRKSELLGVSQMTCHTSSDS